MTTPRRRTQPKSTIRIAVDIGGTFTDGVAELNPGGRIWVGKCLTTPSDPGEAVTTVVADLLRQVDAASGGASVGLVTEVVHGTTLVTNTLIERKGASTGLVLTSGTRDALDIGRETRYDLYDLDLELPRPLVPADARVEIGERLDARGAVRTPPSEVDLAALCDSIERLNVDAVAVCLLHAYANDEHERKVQDALKARFPKLAVCVSSAVAREIREFERMSTTVANAYVQPLMDIYLGRLDTRMQALGVEGPLRIMVSSGGFTSARAAAEVPILLLESGPAGGVLSAVNTALEAGVRDLLAFDMGGTTAKACVTVDGEPLIAHSFEAARVKRFKRGSGLPILIPSIDLIEIGAGGGSIAHVNHLGLLNVGPESSGAEPGPACYGQGGQDATVTDADLLLGYLSADNFLGGEMKLRTDLAEAALARLGKRMGLDAVETAWGICNVVNENMAAAARVHIAEKGYDPRRFTLVATGGAGPVHAVEVARKLRIRRVLSTIAAGAGSCLGLLAAPARTDRAWSRPCALTEVDWREAARHLSAMHVDAQRELSSAGADGRPVSWYLNVEMRYAGQGHNVTATVPYRKVTPALGPELVKAFEARYRHLYGQLVPNGVVEVITWRLTGRSQMQNRGFVWGDARASRQGKPVPTGHRRIYLTKKRKYARVPVYDRYSLPPGTKLPGPVILEERESTLLVPVAAKVSVLKDLTVSIEILEF
jgi:N-methylhydantoinase A